MDFHILLLGGAGGGSGGKLQERKRSRAQPPEGWLGESRSVKKRQVRLILTECRNIADNILSLSLLPGGGESWPVTESSPAFKQ